MSNNSTMSGDFRDRGTQSSTVARYFNDWATASRAVDALRAADFQDDAIGILSRDHKDALRAQDGHKANADGVASKAATGAAIGGVAGLLAALASLTIPGVGPIIAGGVFATTLGTTAAGTGIGAVAGGLIGTLTDMGMSEDDARYYDEGIRNGKTLVTVHDTDRAVEAAAILNQYGGQQRA